MARLSDDSSTATREAFEHWLAADPLRGDAFLRVRDGDGDGIAAIRGIREADASPPRRTRARAGLAVASTAAVALVGGSIALNQFRSGAPEQHEAFAAGQVGRTVALADGSVLELGAGSAITVDFDGGTRRVRLSRGSTRFAVAHDAAHPFIVSAGEHEVIARGTVFDVALTPGALTVSMIEGLVEVRQIGFHPSTAAPIRLGRGQRLIARAQTETVVPINGRASPDATLGASPPASSPPPLPAPPTRSATTLASLVEQVNRTAREPIRLAGDIGSLRLRGEMDVGDSATFARQAALALGLTLTEQNGMLILAPPPP